MSELDVEDCHDADSIQTMDSRLTAGDIDSIRVQAGSPKSPLPPNLKRLATERVLPREETSSSEGTDAKDDAYSEKDYEPDDTNYRFILDPEGELTHDVTTVDVVTMPCPGANPLRAWNRDGLLGRYFGAPSMRDAEGHSENTSSWVRQGIRREANKARILLYSHPDITEGTTLNTLATALLESLLALRVRENQNRPIFFLAHSIGGLIVKLALVKASRDHRYESIWRESYGIAFFGTPHQGSSYFAMPSLAAGIQSLLQLSVPLPESITHDLRVGNALLAHVDEDFKEMASDLRIWTFYETIDSKLSGSVSDQPNGEVYFTAPLAAVKSVILGMRQERIFPMQSDHANVASFGRHNNQTLRLFLSQLSEQIDRADGAANSGLHWSNLNLEQKVHIEVHGFFDDVVSDGVRAWSTRLPLGEFLKKGPDVCLNERLNEIDGEPEPSRFLKTRGRTAVIEHARQGVHSAPPTGSKDVAPMTVKDALGIQNTPQSRASSPPRSPVIRPMDAQIAAVSGSPPPRPQSPVSQISPRQSISVPKPSPLVRAQYEQDLAIDRLSPPLQPRRTARSLTRSMSLSSDGNPRFSFRDFPRFSPRSKSNFGVAGSDDEADGLEASPQLPESIVGIKTVFNNVSHRDEEIASLDLVPAIFTKPEVKARKFIWIHLPYNSPSWAKSILQTLQVSYGKDLSAIYGHDFWAAKHTKGRHAQHYAYFAKPGCYFSAPRTVASRSQSVASRSLSAPPVREIGSTYTTLFFPYLHFDSYKRLIRRRDLIVQRLIQGRARPIPENVSKSDSLECQVIWEQLGHDPPLNCRRTLDQFGYPSLRDTRSRDDDQMLYKLTKERRCAADQAAELRTQQSNGGQSSTKANSTSWRERLNWREWFQEEPAVEEDVLNGNVLMVDQLWLWVINSHTVLTFFPKREGDPIEGPLFQQADLRDSIFNEVNVDLARQCENAFDLAALSVLHATTVLLDRAAHPDLEVFRIFEEAISVLTEKLTSSLKEFREEGVRDKSFDYDAAETKTRSIRARHKEEGRRAEQENRDNTSALLELRDIEDELATLLHLFERQGKVISTMHAIYARAELRDQTANGRVFLNEALKKVSEYMSQAEEMIRRVRNTRDDYDKLLQMVQRQAQVDEVRLSRLHADVASAQSRSVLIFTTFTVIFLPLTFFTGLFGMNTREWGGENNLPLATIGSIAIPASVFLIVASLVVAWSTRVRRLLRFFGRIVVSIDRLLYFVFWRPLSRAVSAQWRASRSVSPGDERGSGAQPSITQEVSDFWDRHRPERDRAYRIPDVNKRQGVVRVTKPRKDTKAQATDP